MWVVIAIVLATLGTAAVFMGRSAAPAEDTTPILAAAAKLASTIEATRGAAQRRAKTLAEEPQLRAAIETDVATLEDLATNEALFSSNRAEQIEVFQLQDRTLMPVLHVPASAGELDASTDYTTTFIAGSHTILVAATAPIAKQTGGTGGAITVAVPSDLSPARSEIARLAKTAQVTGLDHAIPLFAGPSGERSLSLPLGDTKLSLVVTMEAPRPAPNKIALARVPLWTGGFLALLTYALLSARALRRRRLLIG